MNLRLSSLIKKSPILLGLSLLVSTVVNADTYTIIDAIPSTTNVLTDSDGNQMSCTVTGLVGGIARSGTHIAALLGGRCLGLNETGYGRETAIAYLDGALRLVSKGANVPAGFRLAGGVGKILSSGISAGTAFGPFDSSSNAARIVGLFTENPRFSILFPVEIGRFSVATALGDDGSIWGSMPRINNGPSDQVLTPPFLYTARNGLVVLPDIFPNDILQASSGIMGVTIRPDGKYEAAASNGYDSAARIVVTRRGVVQSVTSIFTPVASDLIEYPWTRALDPINMDIHLTYDRHNVNGFLTDRRARIVSSTGAITEITDDALSYVTDEQYPMARACHADAAEAGRAIFSCYGGMDSQDMCIQQSLGIINPGETHVTPIRNLVTNAAAFALNVLTSGGSMTGDLVLGAGLFEAGAIPNNPCDSGVFILQRNA